MNHESPDDPASQPEDDAAPPGPDPDPDFYERALRRIPRWIVVAAAVALPFVWWRGGGPMASSFITGTSVDIGTTAASATWWNC